MRDILLMRSLPSLTIIQSSTRLVGRPISAAPYDGLMIGCASSRHPAAELYECSIESRPRVAFVYPRILTHDLGHSRPHSKQVIMINVLLQETMLQIGCHS
ncbi:hypothetical protein BDM02DRAFT_2990649 [Thelephora ganbajun]|uniref:Uncharacterized protein n=1 Tax=Thelephora ganbajun TaxID=370292 RepID=A0ACB6ZA06_THEGA|nr:hypothetical protein BDM02DRAFT_2990649 [Thelephora ganbajun]